MRVVGGRWRGLTLDSLPGKDIRPTSDRAREALFNILAHAPFVPTSLQGANVLDLFCGTGALGIEAVSRGAASAILIDQDLTAARANLKKVKEPQLFQAIQADAAKLPAAKAPVDFALLDPPYRKGLVGPALFSLVSQGWLKPGSLIVVETAADEALHPVEGLTLLDNRRYGAAMLWFLERA
ncbi:16S rRNA (guanine(966)-N(2))-methyltransferase RsmD [Lacibacterium aquatile]|uniref:16S rRNA (Guanine(966)-N(2))-methyltransferase RsmD n=1 Tax=Lacibacterium aquatile TaxID=1168082 RepID=A0ABW5DMK6_9PROT